MSNWLKWTLAPTITMTAVSSGYCVTYLSTEQAQQAIFPGAKFSPVAVEITPAQKKAIEQASGGRVRNTKPQVWEVTAGGGKKGFFIVDEVIGKHEFINWAIGLNSDGSVKQIEIMDYRETYGGEVRNENWRKQFVGKTSAAPLKLDQDIKNISGATLSSAHITEGVKRVLAFRDACLK